MSEAGLIRFGAGRGGSWLAFMAGAALTLSFAPFGWYPLAWLCVGVLFVLWHGQLPGRAARLGLLFGIGAFLSGTYWLYISIHEIGNAPLILAVMLMLGLVLIMATYYAALGYVCRRWLSPSIAGSWLLLWPAAWVLGEWLRGWVLTGFPWLSLGYGQIDSYLGGIGPVLGLFGLSWAACVTAGALATLLLGRHRDRLWAVILLPALWAGAGSIHGRSWTVPEDRVLTVSMIQGGISQDKKWLPEQLRPTLELFRELTREELGRDLIVWPEAAIPALLGHVGEYVSDLEFDARRTGSVLLLGVLRRDPDKGDQIFNSLVALGDQNQVYEKRHLVPFGEYFPVPDFVRRWMRLMNLPYADIGTGDRDQQPLRVANVEIAASICYEDVFGEEQLDFLPRATLLVNVSNDAWFGDSIAPHQHLQIARMRALETGRYMVRVTNTGISALIDPAGGVVVKSPQFQAHVLQVEARPYTGATPYVRWGNRGVVILMCSLLGTGLLLARRRRRSAGEEGG